MLILRIVADSVSFFIEWSRLQPSIVISFLYPGQGLRNMPSNNHNVLYWMKQTNQLLGDLKALSFLNHCLFTNDKKPRTVYWLSRPGRWWCHTLRAKSFSSYRKALNLCITLGPPWANNNKTSQERHSHLAKYLAWLSVITGRAGAENMRHAW